MTARMTDHAATPALAYCLNCRYTLSQPRPLHCGHCGQETDLHPPSVKEIVHEFVGHYVALEGPLWRSLWALFFLPGRLTREYFAGRRRHYVLPLRIYLTASFLFFVVGHLLPHEEPAAAERGSLVAQSTRDVSTGKTTVNKQMDRDLAACLKPDAHCAWLETQAARVLDKVQGLQGQDLRFDRAAPYAMLLMQPVFALILLMMFAGSGRRYAEHFVFSLHMHAFWFLVLLVHQAVNIAGLLVWAVPLHNLIALRTVYGRGWWANIWRSLLASLFYMLAVAVGSAGLVVIVVLIS